MKSSVRILYLEDNQDDVVLIRSTLKREGLACEVTQVETRAQFIAALESGRVDLILSDFTLPTFDGLAALGLARERLPDVPFVFFSGSLGEEVAIKCLKTGATDYVMKNRNARIVPAVRRALREAEEKAQHKLAEEELRSREEWVRLLVEEVRDHAIFMLDPDGHVFSWNAGAERLKGYRADEIIGRHFSCFYRPEEVESGWPAQLLRVAANQGSIEDEGWRVRKDGSCYWANVVITALHDKFGNLRGFAKIVRDLSERKRAEEKLREREERYRSLVEASPNAIFINKEDRIVFINTTCLQLFGATTPDQILGKSPFEFVHPDYHPGVRERMRHLLEHREPVSLVEEKMIRLDGTVVDVEVVACSFIDQGVPAVQVVLRDITDRKQLEEQFHQAQKLEAVGRLAAGVAHDFSNLLTVINGYSQLLLSETSAGSQNRKELEEIRKAGERSARLTQQLLAFSRKQTVQFQVLDLNKVVRNLETLLKRMIGEDVALVTKFNPGLGWVNADPGQIEQILMNLAVNARDAMPSGGTLAIETTDMQLDEKATGTRWELEAGFYVVLSVSDTGCGMDDAIQARIFEPFFTTKESGKGTGLGLATVYGIVKQHKGAVSVYSEVGQGTTFKIYFPRVDAPAVVEESVDEGSEPPTGSETILLVEDSDMLRDLARHSLERRGYTVIEASNGEEAIRVAERQVGPIHLVLTDVVMPGINGRQLVERLTERRPGVRVLYMTGYAEGVLTHHGIVNPSVNLLAKPFTPTSLAWKIQAILSRDPSEAEKE